MIYFFYFFYFLLKIMFATLRHMTYADSSMPPAPLNDCVIREVFFCPDLRCLELTCTM